MQKDYVHVPSDDAQHQDKMCEPHGAWRELPKSAHAVAAAEVVACTKSDALRDVRIALQRVSKCVQLILSVRH
jgi:hypothetical protein